jgi:thioredoxin reductase (NADPH)
MAKSDVQEAIVVGAGPAGLTAAIYLGRYRRRCLVLDSGQSRARWIPTSHNIPGFAAGIGGERFLRALREQASRYGAEFSETNVWDLTFQNGRFTLATDLGRLRSRFVILATGVQDHLPAIEGASEALQRGLVRVCPICDAYEAIDKRIAVLSDGALGEREAQFLKHYSGQVTLLSLGHAVSSPRSPADRVECIVVRPDELRIEEDRVIASTAAGEREFDVLYLALGCSPRHDLARKLGATFDEHGALRVSAHQETTVPGLYAAGDVVRGLNQVIVAAAESAIAATAIHNQLRVG